jgi:hypothetical protein
VIKVSVRKQNFGSASCGATLVVTIKRKEKEFMKITEKRIGEIREKCLFEVKGMSTKLRETFESVPFFKNNKGVEEFVEGFEKVVQGALMIERVDPPTFLSISIILKCLLIGPSKSLEVYSLLLKEIVSKGVGKSDLLNIFPDGFSEEPLSLKELWEEYKS